MEPEVAEIIPPAVRPFADVLRDLGKGQVVDEAAVMLTDLVQAVTTYGKQGTFTLKIKIAPVKGGDQVMVSASAASSPPAGDPVTSMFFTDTTGNLLRNDPRQGVLMELREVARPDAELRTARDR